MDEIHSSHEDAPDEITVETLPSYPADIVSRLNEVCAGDPMPVPDEHGTKSAEAELPRESLPSLALPPITLVLDGRESVFYFSREVSEVCMALGVTVEAMRRALDNATPRRITVRTVV